MSQIIDAIYEDGVFKPLKHFNLKERTRVQLQISMEEDLREQADEILKLAKASCEGLSDEELAIMESTKLNGMNFFSNLEKSK